MSEADVVIVGAGPAGLAAALSLADSGLTVAHVEARQRIGGRTSTLNIGRHGGVDVGAHWMHAPRINPLAKAARRLGVELLTADRWPIVIDGDEILGSWGQMKLWRAWRKIDRGIVRLADDHPGAAASLAVDRSDRWQILAGELHGTHACGISLSEVSVEDFANAVDSEDRFVAGGYGALVERAAAGVAPRLGVTVRAIHETATGVRVETDAGDIAARAVLVTVPTTCSRAKRSASRRACPRRIARRCRICRMAPTSGSSFTLGDDPFTEERDRAVILLNDQNKSFYMLAGGGGPGVHFADFGGAEARELAAAGIDAMAEVVEDWLDLQVGSAVARSIKPLHASAWSGDPLSMGGWSVARPGRANARLVLRTPIAGRIWFAGEATSVELWGTVGGAWLEGQRAAGEIRRCLDGRARPPGITDVLSRRERQAARARPRNLT